MLSDLLIHRLDQIDESLRNLTEEVMANRVEIAKLKVRASMWGGIAGLGGAVLALIWKIIGG